jgi:sugar phosphate isomerase/epimerase
MIDLGFVSAILAGHTFEEVIDFAARHKFKCVELMCWPVGKAERRYAGVTHIDVSRLDKSRANEIKNFLQVKGVYISGLGYYPNLLDPEAMTSGIFSEHLAKVIRGAAMLEVPVVNTFIGRDFKKSTDENFELFRTVWPDIVKTAEDYGVKIGIENCPMLFTIDEWPGGKNLAVSPAVWDRLFEVIPSRSFGLNYDPSHLVWQMMDPVRPIYDYRDRIFHIHLKDAKVYKDKLNRVGILATPLEYHSPKLPGLGDVNWSHFFAALTDIRYRGPACIEVEDKAFEGSQADIETAILTSRNYLAQFTGP